MFVPLRQVLIGLSVPHSGRRLRRDQSFRPNQVSEKRGRELGHEKEGCRTTTFLTKESIVQTYYNGLQVSERVWVGFYLGNFRVSVECQRD